jgi:non-specific serine/threonine protein kinase
MAAESVPVFGDLLRRARRAAGLTQEELAERAGVSVRGVSDLERGVIRAPRSDTLELLADALGLAPEERRQWERLRRRLAASAAPTAVPAAPDAHGAPPLPTPFTSFVGREREIEEITALLRQPHERLLTLTGPGGVGKTRLALAVAREVAAAYPDGVWFVDLAPLTDPNHVLPAMATTLGVSLAGATPADEVLSNALRDKHLLAVLDNVEHVVAVAPALAGLLHACPQLSILATSRVPLHLQAEQVYVVAPLGLPAPDAPAESLRRSDAVALFEQRARAVQSDFRLTDDSARAVAEICRRLDGLPLAIELAATRIRVLPLRALRDRLKRALPLLMTGARDAPARQQTLRNAIVWSYDLLAPEQQRLFRALSVFRGGWTLEAAEEIARHNEAARGLDTLTRLEALVEQSLVWVHEQPDGTARYTMLETIREFGQEQLATSGETAEAHRRHASYFARYFEDAEWEWSSPDVVLWMERAAVELSNVRTALAWAIEHDPETALRLNWSIALYWERHGDFREGQRWYEQALRNSQPFAIDIRANALLHAGDLATSGGDYAAAQLLTEESLSLFRTTGDYHGIARSLWCLGRIAMWTAEYEQAQRLFEESADLARNRIPYLFANAYMNLGVVARAQGRDADAAAYLNAALESAKQADHRSGIAFVLSQLALLALKADDLYHARSLLNECLTAYRQVRDQRLAGQALEVAAWLAAVERQPERAARLLGSVGALRGAIGVPVPPTIQTEYDEYLPRAKAQIDAAAWDRAYAEGAVLTLDGAIEYALMPEAASAAELSPLPAAGLSKRELDVLRLLAAGKSNQEIAAALVISPHTAANHVASIMNKFGVDSRTAAATWAVKHGVV